MYIYSHKQYKREAGHMKMNTTASECSYARLPVQVVSGKGSWLTDADGKNRSQYQCKINGVNMRVFRCRLKVVADDSSEDDFLK